MSKGLLYQKSNDATTVGPIINIYIVYKTSPRTTSSSFILKNCLFGAVKITNTTNSDPDKAQYGGYGIGFDTKGEFTQSDGGEYGKMLLFLVLITSRHPNSKTKHVSVLGKDFVQKINDTTIYAEKMYSPNFTVDNKTFCFSLHYNGDNSY